MLIESNAPTKQGELAKWLGVSQPTISDYRNGVIHPKIERAVEIAEKLGCCVEWLLTGRGDKYPTKTSDSFLDISSLTEEEKSHFKAIISSFSQRTRQRSTSNGN
jgi:DNA-binding XRE family transcriptional regulator